MSAVWRYASPKGDPGGERHAASIHLGCLAIGLAFALSIVRSVVWRNGDQAVPMALGELTAIAALLLNRAGRSMWAVRLALSGLMLTIVMLVSGAHDGFRSIVMLAFPGLLLIAVMLLRTADYLVLAFATLLTVTGLGVAEMYGLIPTVPLARTQTDLTTVFFVDLILVVIAIFGGLLARDARLNLAGIRATVDQLAAANRELERSEAKYRSFIELAVDAIFVLDGNGSILEVNRQASALAGAGREQLLGASMMTILTPVEPDGNPLPLDVLGAGVPIMRLCRLGRPDGTVVEAEIHSAMLPDGLILCFCRDISERKRAGEERKELQAQLVQAQKMESIGRLAGGVAHDFNNLLTVINGYSRLLLDKLDETDPRRDSIEQIQLSGLRAAGLTQQLLAFSRRQILQPHVLDLNNVVREVRPMLARLVGEHIELCLTLSPEAATVYADPTQLHQVIMNLAVNARDAMPRGGRLLIETRAEPPGGARTGPSVILEVRDNGEGMDEETRRHIFEPFFTTKPSGQGTGLGLSMIHGIVEQSHGSIEVDSAPGRGTAFGIYLPAVEKTPPGAAELAGVPVTEMAGRETVLVVEDQPDVRKYAADALGKYGYRVIQAAGAAEALLLCERDPGGIDLVLTDVVMPDISGWELEKRLAIRCPAIKVLFMSGYTDDTAAEQGPPRQGREILQKPFSPEQLAVKIRGLLAMPARRRRILVADDEAAVRGFLRAVLEGGGYDVIEAANGMEAIAAVRAGQVDVLITDLVMPEREGIETIRTLHAEAASLGIIAISGAAGGDYLSAARRLGAHTVLRKPVNAGQLLAKVAELLKVAQ